VNNKLLEILDNDDI